MLWRGSFESECQCSLRFWHTGRPWISCFRFLYPQCCLIYRHFPLRARICLSSFCVSLPSIPLKVSSFFSPSSVRMCPIFRDFPLQTNEVLLSSFAVVVVGRGEELPWGRTYCVEQRGERVKVPEIILRLHFD